MIGKISLFVLLVAATANADDSAIADTVKCSRDFRKIGCFVRDLRLVPDLLITDLDPTHENFTTDIDWGNYGTSLHSLACRCRQMAYGKYKYFGMGMYGECVAGNDNPALEALFKNTDHVAYSCVNGEYDNCDVDKVEECSGTVDYDFFYEILKGDCSSQIAKGDVLSLFKTQTLIEKNKKVATIPELGMLYDISFEVYPTSFQSGWASVLHMTISGNNDAYGARIPGIFFHPSSTSAKTNKLVFRNAINGNKDYDTSSSPLALNKWTQVRVNQQHEDMKYVYRVHINNQQVLQTINSYPMPFQDVSVFAGDPWNAPQAGYVRNLKIAENCYDISASKPNVLSIPKESILVKNTLLGTIPTLCKEYSLSFQVKPTSYGTGWHNVLHVTTGGNYAMYGDRVPGVWFSPNPSANKNKLHICAPINKNKNYCYNSQLFPTNNWISVKIKQERLGVEYYYSIDINGKEVKKVKNIYPTDFYGVKVYAADPWHKAQAGSVRNVNLDGKCYDTSTNTKGISVPAEKVLVRNTLLGTLPILCKQYTVSLQVKPTSYGKGWRSILHLSNGGNYGKYGNRVPGIWFHPSNPSAKKNRLHICGPVNKNFNWNYNSQLFPKNEWISVKVKQVRVGQDYYYSIDINGKEVKKVKNTYPSFFYGVKVYAADPWHAAQAGSIRNINVQETCDETYTNEISVPAEKVLVKNTFLGTIPILCKQYTVSLDVKPTSYGTGWRSIFHLSNGGNYGKYGDRVPGVWFRPSKTSAATNKLHICGPVSRNANWCYNSQSFPKNKWIRVKVKQVKVGQDYYYSIDINGKQVRKVKNTYPSSFYGVKAYAADPWHAAQAGSIRNINIDGGNCNNE